MSSAFVTRMTPVASNEAPWAQKVKPTKLHSFGSAIEKGMLGALGSKVPRNGGRHRRVPNGGNGAFAGACASPEVRTPKESGLPSVIVKQRSCVAALAVPGLPQVVDDTPNLTERRGLAVAKLLRERSIRVVPAPALGPEFRLVAAVEEQQP